MIKTRLLLIIIIAVVCAIAIPAWFIVIEPMLRVTVTTPKLELLEGEFEGQNSQILMFEYQPRDAIKSIKVSNEHGGYNFYYDEDKKDFYIEDYLNAPYSKEQIGVLISHAGYPNVMTRVTEKTDNLKQYGLDESDSPAYYELTTRKGDTYKVYIGDMIPSGQGYYVKLDGRDAVYVKEASISQTLLAPIENMVTPILFMPFSQSNFFMVKDFILLKYETDEEKTETEDKTEEKGEDTTETQPAPAEETKDDPFRDSYENLDAKKVFVAISTITKTTKDENGNEVEEFEKYEMYYPGTYQVSDSFDLVLQNFMEPNGEKVVVLGKDDEIIKKDVLEQYGLTSPAYELFFTHNGIKNDILISEKQEDGSYYAYSLLFNCICKMPETLFEFLDWNLLDYVQKPIFLSYITDISSIAIKTPDFEETFILYTSEGETVKNPVTNTTTTTTNIDIKLKSNGEFLKNPDYFKQFYMGLLNINLKGESDVEDETGLECMATITIHTKKGELLNYAFYPYRTRRCLYTLNGKGNFYVLKETVETVVENAKKLVKGEPVSYM